MVKLRLQRRGRKKLPIYKIVAADSRFPRDGRFIEAVGQYRPLEYPIGVSLDQERVLYWLGVGAQPTDTVRSLLSKEGIMLRFHLMRKGKSEEEIQNAMAEWQASNEARKQRQLSKKQQRTMKKKQEEAAKKAEEAAKKAEEEAKKATEEAKKAAEETLKAQETAAPSETPSEG